MISNPGRRPGQQGLIRQLASIRTPTRPVNVVANARLDNGQSMSWDDSLAFVKLSSNN
jgi:hypothetical protein